MDVDITADDEPYLAESDQAVIHSFVDEAGDSTIFNNKGKVLIGTNGCSRFFMMGKLDVENPPDLSAKLKDLRAELLNDPYFSGVRALDPHRSDSAHMFHATDDPVEVRYQVYRLLAAENKNLRFHAVVCDKQAVLETELAKREKDARHRHNQEELYDHLVCKLFASWQTLADNYNLCVAKRGNKSRNGAITTALQLAETEFADRYSLTRSVNWNVKVSDPASDICLQAADYFLWALQRFYELRTVPVTGEIIREDRYLKKLWPQFATVHDLHFGELAAGTTFTRVKPLTIETRFQPAKKGKKKMP